MNDNQIVDEIAGGRYGDNGELRVQAKVAQTLVTMPLSSLTVWINLPLDPTHVSVLQQARIVAAPNVYLNGSLKIEIGLFQSCNAL